MSPDMQPVDLPPLDARQLSTLDQLAATARDNMCPCSDLAYQDRDSRNGGSDG